MAREPAASSRKKRLKSRQPVLEGLLNRTGKRLNFEGWDGCFSYWGYARARVRARARTRASGRARARARASTSLELGLGLVRVSCIIKKKWFKQNSAAMCRCPSDSCTGPSKE